MTLLQVLMFIFSSSLPFSLVSSFLFLVTSHLFPTATLTFYFKINWVYVKSLGEGLWTGAQATYQGIHN